MEDYPIMIAYWGEFNDVLYADFIEYEPQNCERIYYAMEQRIAYGNSTEVLEYIPAGNTHINVDDRVGWWREQMRNLGYKIEI